MKFSKNNPKRQTLRDKNFAGGDDRDRTGGLLLAKQALSQLSYVPGFLKSGPTWTRPVIRRGATPYGVANHSELTSVWAHLDSNQGPLRYQHSALTT